MTLPKIFNPVHDIKIPSLKKSFKFRQFLVKEEKILLTAKETNDPFDFLSAITQVVCNCSLDNSFDLNKIAIFDLEYIFLKLRSISVDNISEISYEIKEKEKIEKYDFKINLDNVEVVFPPNINNNIPINQNMGIIMKYPMASLYNDKQFLNIKKDYLYNLLLRCMDKIYEGEDIYEIKDYSMEEISVFVDNLTPTIFASMMNFLTNLPSLHHVEKYTDSSGQEKEVVFRSLSDFFTFR